MNSSAWCWAALVAGASLALPRPVWACACGGQGPESALTAQTERWGLRLSQTAESAHGLWDMRGNYISLRPQSRETLLELAVLAAVRPVKRVELSVREAFGRKWSSSAETFAQDTGFSDATLRARWEVLDEPRFPKRLPWPSLTTVFELRAPFGRVDRALQRGLGAWELATAVRLERTFGMDYRLALLGQVGYRFPDRAFQVEEHLGPRALGELTFSYAGWDPVVLTVLTNLSWEGERSQEGRVVRGSAQRLWNVGLLVGFFPERSPLRVGLALRTSPPVGGVSVNAVGTMAAEIWVARVFP